MSYIIDVEEKDFLEQICEDLNASFVSDYNGRFMYESTCIGFVSDQPIRFMLQLVRELLDSGFEDLVEQLVDSQSRTDNMGLRTIVYWPYISFSEDQSKEVDEYEERV
jgi:hypothetical protein